MTIDLIAMKERLAAYRKASDAAYKAWATRLEKVMADRNNGIPPVRGKNFKGEEVTYHAPCDGYLHEWVEGDTHRSGTYMGGQFLPIDKYDEPSVADMFQFGATSGNKICDVPLDALGGFPSIFNEALEESIMTTGDVYTKQWGPFAGQKMCYVYLNGKLPKDIVEAVERHLLADQWAVLAKIDAEKEAKQAEQEARAAAAPDVPEERLEIVGEVLTTKWQDSDWGGAFKMLVIDDRGFKVWGSVPRAIEDDVARGKWVAFVATCEPSKDDPKFGFFKRPSKAKCWDPEEVAA